MIRTFYLIDPGDPATLLVTFYLDGADLWKEAFKFRYNKGSVGNKIRIPCCIQSELCIEPFRNLFWINHNIWKQPRLVFLATFKKIFGS